MISFVFPQEKKKSAKINIFESMVQPQEIYEHIGEEIKMMDLLADVCLCFVCLVEKSVCACVCVRALQSFLAATIGALFLFMCVSFSELYI